MPTLPGNRRKSKVGEPERVEFMARLMENPQQRLEDVAKAVGIPKATAQALARRLMAKGGQPVVEEYRRLSSEKLAEMFDSKLQMIMSYVDPLTVGTASLKDLAIAAGIFTEKRQLLRGHATQIVTVDDRRKLNELMPKLLQEARRRGLEIDGEAVDVTPKA